MPERYDYPGTRVLKNRFGVRDASLANELEAVASFNRRTQPVPNFSTNLGGLKAVHRHLFQDVWEWAGKTRGEKTTIDGQTFTPQEHWLKKGDVRFGKSTELGQPLRVALTKVRIQIEELNQLGGLTKDAWASLTARQIGIMNSAHPFKEGNGRAMRRYIELSAEQYGFQARIIGGPEWMAASHNAMNVKHTGKLQEFISRNTIARNTIHAHAGSHSSPATGLPKETDMAANPTSPTMLARESKAAAGAKVARVAADAVEKTIKLIQDPIKQTEARKVLQAIAASEAKLQKLLRAESGHDNKAYKPAQQPGRGRKPYQDIER